MLVPLAIRINTPSSTSQTSYHTWNVPAPQTTTPVFTRRDDVGDEYSDWLVAKMWVRVADVHYHILGSLITSRLLTETVSLAVYRCLPSVHPVFTRLTSVLILHRTRISAVKVKVKVWTLAIAPLIRVTSSALQSRKWQLIGMSQWCRSALCGHLLPASEKKCGSPCVFLQPLKLATSNCPL